MSYKRKFKLSRSNIRTIVVIVAILGFAAYEQIYNDKVYLPPSFTKVINKTLDPYDKSIKGRATISDGDTIRIGITKIRLDAIDAPELSQNCFLKNGKPYPCGQDAKRKLEILIGQNNVRCDYSKKDQYGRLLAICYNDQGQDLNAAMVTSGNALAYLYYSNRYNAEQSTAKTTAQGIWQGKFKEPYLFRQEK